MSNGVTRRQVIGGVAIFGAMYATGAQSSGRGGGDVVAPGGGFSESDMALHEDPEFAVADTHSDLNNFSPDGVGFVLVWDEQITYRVE